MTSILAFDSRSLSILLSDDNQHLFDPEYPIFYKNKINKGKIEKKSFVTEMLWILQSILINLELVKELSLTYASIRTISSHIICSLKTCILLLLKVLTFLG